MTKKMRHCHLKKNQHGILGPPSRALDVETDADIKMLMRWNELPFAIPGIVKNVRILFKTLFSA